MKFIDCFSNPYGLSLAIIKLWSTQSNALERLVKTVLVSSPLSRVLCHFPTIAKHYNAVHWNLSETHTEIWKTLCENMDRFEYTLVSDILYLD